MCDIDLMYEAPNRVLMAASGRIPSRSKQMVNSESDIGPGSKSPHKYKVLIRHRPRVRKSSTKLSMFRFLDKTHVWGVEVPFILILFSCVVGRDITRHAMLSHDGFRRRCCLALCNLLRLGRTDSRKVALNSYTAIHAILLGTSLSTQHRSSQSHL